ncbi:MAG TPA: hypothetical protein VHH32_01930 [Gemmatimonadales bacterium]|nr:hypothetical protein [Gemmatimonadales bacterium]
MTAPRIFLLSPAHCGGKRAAILLNERATFPLAQRFRSAGLTIGEAFTFLSGLYFRGKLTYAARFAHPPRGYAGVQVITTNRGLVTADLPVRPADLLAFGAVDIGVHDTEYRDALHRDLSRLQQIPKLEIVLLGSVATGKYVDVLLDVMGERLLFPVEFVGRGDMSRGALLLRAAEEGRELAYAPVAGSVRRGHRPPRLAPRRSSDAAPPKSPSR